MRNSANALLLVVVLFSSAASSQTSPTRPRFLDNAKVEERGGAITVEANAPRPLDQAITALRQQFGWVVDYEDPPYGPKDLVDNTDPWWRAAHPTAIGVNRVAGGRFTALFQSSSGQENGHVAESDVLSAIVAAYNKSGNPGTFALIKDGDGRFSVVGVASRREDGTDAPVTPVLDIRVSIPAGERTVAVTVQSILRAVSEESGQRIELGSGPVELLIHTKVKVGGVDVPARKLLGQVASATKFPLVWRVLYEADAGMYFLNLEPTTRVESDASGNRILRPVEISGPGRRVDPE